MEALSAFRHHSSFGMNKLKKPIIEIMHLEEATEKKGVIETNEIIFVLKGRCELNCDLCHKILLSENQAIFFPVGCHYKAHSEEENLIIIIRLDPFQKIPGCYSIDELYKESDHSWPSKENIHLLAVNEKIRYFLDSLYNYIEDGFENVAFHDLKTKELIFLLNRYYSKKELAEFFKPILNKGASFATFVLENWRSIKTAKEFARLSNYSETSFAKKFKEVFGVAPYKWLNERRASHIYYEITNTNKPIKIIAEEYQFNSLQHFNDYCIRNFHLPPGTLRKR